MTGTATIKLRTGIKNGTATIRALIKHPMEVGSRGKIRVRHIPSHFITDVTCEHNGKVVLNAYWGPGISKNPYLSFSFADAAEGDRFSIAWRDNRGGADLLETRL